MSTAVDCLEFLPDELVVEVSRGLSGCGDDLPQCKKLMYEVLAQHYGHGQPPLLSNHVFDIHSGISELLGRTGATSFSELGGRVLKPNPLLSVASEREAGSGSGGPPAQPEAAGPSQQGGAPQAPQVHGHGGQAPGGQTPQRGESGGAPTGSAAGARSTRAHS